MEAPFFSCRIATVIWLIVLTKMPPVRGHLEHTARMCYVSSRFVAQWECGGAVVYGRPWSLATSRLSAVVALLVSNVGIREQDLLSVYFVGGVLTVFTGQSSGASRTGMASTGLLCPCSWPARDLALTSRTLPLWLVLTLSDCSLCSPAAGSAGIGIMSLAVHPRQRGAFMSLTACTRDLVSGITTAIAALLVTRALSGFRPSMHPLRPMPERVVSLGCTRGPAHR